MDTQAKRDAPKKVIAPLEGSIADDTKVPSPSQWASFLRNREDKRKLVEYLGVKILEAQKYLKQGQVVIAGGCFDGNETFKISSTETKKLSELKCHHEEADTRMFAHAAWTKKKCVQFVASDTDVLAILLLNHEAFSEKQVVIQSSDFKGTLDATKLMKDMENDGQTELSRLRNTGVSSSLLYGTMHALIGSDILCSPRGFGPSAIIQTCLEYATYLFETTTGLQNLHKENESSRGAYIRFILALFKKKYSSKVTKRQEEILCHAQSYSDIISEMQRETWVHTLESKAMIPTEECLLLREKNLAFQLIIWKQATNPQMIVPRPEQYGWEKEDSGLVLQADSKENTQKQKSVFDTIMRKCKCKSSGCKTNRCSCRKNKNACTSLCECVNCENTNTHHKKTVPTESVGQPEILDSEEEIETSSSEDDESESDNSDDEPEL